VLNQTGKKSEAVVEAETTTSVFAEGLAFLSSDSHRLPKHSLPKAVLRSPRRAPLTLLCV